MNVDTWLLLACAVISILCASYLVAHEDYDDGAFGRAFLVSVWLMSLWLIYAIVVVEERFESDLMILVFSIGQTLFMARCAVKFLLWHRFGVSSWRPKGCKQRFGAPPEEHRDNGGGSPA